MTKPVTIPNTFATATTAIPLSQLDSDFSAVATALNDANTYSNYAADTGVANAYVVTLTGVSTTYSAGLRIQFKAGAANTGASTLNVNGGGTKNITFQDASALSSGTIAANAIVDVMYDGTQFLLMNDPAGTVGTGDVVGPAGATANAAAIFDSTTGKLIKDSKVIITPVANSSTLTIANNKTVTVNNTLTLSGTDSTTMTFPSTNATIARTDAAQTFTGTQTFSSDASVNGLTVGRGAGAVATNTAVGASALATSNTGPRQTAIGYRALSAYSGSVGYNVAIGSDALQNTTGSYDNVAVGDSALNGVSSGLRNVGVGNNAIAFSQSGSDNTAVGTSALRGASLNSFSYNTAVGSNALFSNTTASNNTAVGYQAGYSNQTSGGAVFIGYQAGYGSVGISTTINYNTAIGYQAGYGLNSGYSNTLIGNGSGSAINSGYKNSILGGFSGNQGGLDIRTASNYIVLSDGDGNPLISTNSTRSVALNGAVPQTGTGITFPATQNASSNAKTLDDYEEGTYNPTITSGFTTPGYSLNAGRYTKVGRICYFAIRLTVSSGTRNSSILEISLPFTSVNDTSMSNTGGAWFSFVNSGVINSTTTNLPTLYNGANTNSLQFYKTDGNNFVGTDLNSATPDFYIHGWMTCA